MPKVLIADDEEFVRSFLKTTLESYGFEVVGEVETGDELFSELNKKHPDILLLDLNMPNMTGDDFLKEHAKEFPRTCFIMLTSIPVEEMSNKDVVLSNVSCCIRKDTSVIEMMFKIKKAWGQFKEDNWLKMYNENFQLNLAKKINIDAEIIKKLFEDNKEDVYKVALALISDYEISKEKLGKIWGNCLGYAYVNPNVSIVKPEYVKKLGAKLIKKYQALPMYKFGEALTVATSDPYNPYLQVKMEKLLDEVVSFVFCFSFDIENYISTNRIQ